MRRKAPTDTNYTGQHKKLQPRVHREPHEIPLTEWQVTMLQHIADGYTAKQIAEKYHSTPTMPRATLRVAMKKLEARTYTEAAIVALRRGIIQ